MNAAKFEKLALGSLEKIFSKSDTALLTGGSGLYIQAICEGFDDILLLRKRFAPG